jgi:hypothetical protein
MLIEQPTQALVDPVQFLATPRTTALGATSPFGRALAKDRNPPIE